MSDTTIPEQADPRDARIAELEAELARVQTPRELRDHAEKVKQENAEQRVAHTQVVAERAAEAERIGDLVAELMFTKAGVDTDDPRPRRRRRQARPRRPQLHHQALHRHPRQPRHRRRGHHRPVVAG
jgi:hypothetical protein